VRMRVTRKRGRWVKVLWPSDCDRGDDVEKKTLR
jgi:hypothetical protein